MARIVRGFSTAMGTDIARTISTAMENVGLELNATQIDGKDINDLAVIDSVTGKIPASVLPLEVVQVDAIGKIPVKKLPNFVATINEYQNTNFFPVIGETGVLYLAGDTDLIYKWDAVTNQYQLFQADIDNLQKQIDQKVSNSIISNSFSSISAKNALTASYVTGLLS